MQCGFCEQIVKLQSHYTFQVNFNWTFEQDIIENYLSEQLTLSEYLMMVVLSEIKLVKIVLVNRLYQRCYVVKQQEYNEDVDADETR